jgi:uncharacterized protein YndB with AHSA1/START domain
MTITVVDAGPRQVSRSVEVHAPVAQLFALVADPHRHRELDGSGTVRDAVSGPAQLSLGATFRVRMHMFGLPYRITSKVTAFETDKVVEWRHPVGHRWRWEFTALTPDTTLVTETFDYRGAGKRKNQLGYYERFGFAKQNAAGIEATLRKLAATYAPATPGNAAPDPATSPA